MDRKKGHVRIGNAAPKREKGREMGIWGMVNASGGEEMWGLKCREEG